MTAPPTLFDWQAKRDSALAKVESNAGEAFMSLALKFCAGYLRRHGEAAGEDITDACVEAGIKPHDARAFGPVFKALIKDGIIERVGFCLRKKGNGTAGGSVYRIKKL